MTVDFDTIFFYLLEIVAWPLLLSLFLVHHSGLRPPVLHKYDVPIIFLFFWFWCPHPALMSRRGPSAPAPARNVCAVVAARYLFLLEKWCNENGVEDSHITAVADAVRSTIPA